MCCMPTVDLGTVLGGRMQLENGDRESWYCKWDVYLSAKYNQLASINKYIVYQKKMNAMENRMGRGKSVCTGRG